MHADRRLLSVEMIAAPLLAVGLLALAVLQYHWLDQWRIAEAQSRQAALQTLAKGTAARIDAVVEQHLNLLRSLLDENGLLDLNAAQPLPEGRSALGQVLWVADAADPDLGPVWRLERGPRPRFVQSGYAELAQTAAPLWANGPSGLSGALVDGGAPLLIVPTLVRTRPELAATNGALIARLRLDTLRALLTELNRDSDSDYAVLAELSRSPSAHSWAVPTPANFPGQPAAGHWSLLLNYRAGSAADLAEKLKHRNLIVAAGILLLLAASAGLLWMVTRQRRRLAAQRLSMIATVSHELRTPLAVIDSAAANLAEGITASAEGVAAYGRLIRDHSQRLRRLVEHALAPGVLASSGEGRSHRDCSAPLSTALQTCLDKLAEAQARQRLHCSGPMPLIAVDATDLDLMLSNLIGNALRYADPGSSVRLHTEIRRSWLRLGLSNDCRELQPDEAKRLFEPFFRGQHARSVHQPGSGLGLNLTLAISQRYGGDLRHRLQDGQIHFELRLPLASSASKADVSKLGDAKS